ncbi:hypothetical protein [Agarivorans sp. QJM3NY_33]|uniref:hypothetical protein n=1 Tax=Agarivorans sp. QJM3NY_33 TaxID=3421432 RepID=UPI003D7D4817
MQTYNCNSFSLIIGVICGSTTQVEPLLNDINNLIKLPYLIDIEVHILANGEKCKDINSLLKSIFNVSESLKFRVHESGQNSILPIGQARSKLQKLVGTRMKNKESSYAWILDDDMRIPDRASAYLTWLPAFKDKGVDVLVGNFNGSSPNPPAHGIRVQLNDVIHNLKWLNSLPDDTKLLNREHENKQFRLKYSDYYYDLSRKHREHLEIPYWIVPEYEGETVGNAKQRIIKNVGKILTGEPFLRPLDVSVSENPLEDSEPSCNRGGNTFILTAEALTNTPNAIMLTNGEENRRSDMIWAVINKYYHNFTIHSISFPVYHHRYVNVSPSFSLSKTISEIRGSALYAAMLSFFQSHQKPSWEQLKNNGSNVSKLYFRYINNRLKLYKDNFKEINLQLDIIESEYISDEKGFNNVINSLRDWISEENFEKIKAPVIESSNSIDIVEFVKSLDYQIESFNE